MHKLPVLVEHLCGAWGIWVAAELARAERQAMLSERQRVQAAERMAFPVGAVVFGAPLARGLAVEEDYDLRVVVAAPTNSTDDYLLGYVPAGGTMDQVRRGFSGATSLAYHVHGRAKGQPGLQSAPTTAAPPGLGLARHLAG